MWSAPYPLKTADKSVLVMHDSFVNVPMVSAQYSQFFATGFDVHWSYASSLVKTPKVQTVVMESVDRTFMPRLMRLPGIDEATEDSTDMIMFLDYLRRN